MKKTPDTRPMRLWDVTVEGYGTSPVYARSRAAAIYQAFLSDAFSSYRFGQFIRIARARARPTTPEPDGYDYVRRNYNLDCKVGQRCRIKNEGPSWNGKEGVVLYPGPSTAHVHILVDGMDHISHVHPYSVELLP